MYKMNLVASLIQDLQKINASAIAENDKIALCTLTQPTSHLSKLQQDVPSKTSVKLIFVQYSH